MKKIFFGVMMIVIIMLAAHSFAWGQNKKKLPQVKKEVKKSKLLVKPQKMNAKILPFQIKEPENEAERREQIREGLRSIRRYDDPKLMLVDDNYFNEPPPPEYVMHRTGIYKYITQAHKIDKQEIYLKGEGLNEFYPGAMFYVDYNLAIGNPTVMSGIDRGKITLFGTFISDQKNTQNNVDISSRKNIQAKIIWLWSLELTASGKT
ncbi:MAG: hypothetical protein CSB01_03010 [Bacteroidia bacterium]|nr:MAG: hypothetical protein CSB01_03010 [Bacteroidia bacterium]